MKPQVDHVDMLHENDHHNQLKPRRKRRGRFLRFIQGYLMFVGGLTTLYVLAQLIVMLFVEIAKWSASNPFV